MNCHGRLLEQDNTALFSLVAHSPETEAIVRRPENEHLQPDETDGKLVLRIGHMRSKTNNKDTIVTIGRLGDIFVPDLDISRIHCSFELNSDGDGLMLCDKSSTRTTQVYGNGVLGINRKIQSYVALVPSVELTLGIGLRMLEQGEEKDATEPEIFGYPGFTYRIKFKLVWHCSYKDAASSIKARAAYNLPDTPQLSRTLELVKTSAPSRIQTASQTPNRHMLHTRLRCVVVGDPIASGTFGTVSVALDVDNCRYVAAKHIRQWLQDVKQTETEISRLSSFCHPHVVSYLGWADSYIYMELMRGNLEELVTTVWFETWLKNENRSSPTQETATQIPVYTQMIALLVLDHMGRALVYLHDQGIVHRDIKPANILFLWSDGKITLKLCDFGLSNEVVNAASYVGSPAYTAPEIISGQKQTCAVDIWSLFVVFVWLFDIDNFRKFITKRRSPEQLRDAIQKASRNDLVFNFHSMVDLEPSKRPTAKQLLTYCEKANGETPLSIPCQRPTLKKARKRVLRDTTVPQTLQHRKSGHNGGIQKARRRVAANTCGMPGTFPLSY